MTIKYNIFSYHNRLKIFKLNCLKINLAYDKRIQAGNEKKNCFYHLV